ncbi:acyl-CoA carboxylase subunit epsilon (plasmid) [Streptomyces sp. NBC_01387]|uniref:acyl-CoA carboxylase subunit epsilon n=1 Tax=unclassified Streptomyces TaxID=2593676 RepID=UPI0022541C6B|nr:MULTISPECIES: acyl-CoA carboxylase subunit epsilon [unclassified Streptomyces]MCX4554456.1 acyl-CoA carboxylase subunit epsilon [Streptomyces sp. NBC_01500]WSC25160.1 acyl-CoA carboxylase subunit epsilon [Streptomyces sp. NBC_01766]WSV58958.1 acyl-CoA carboxylase subunit epsilon [Streptomyces sp. NBC_01014]
MSSVEGTETVVRVESGVASDEELAALVALFTLLSRSREQEQENAGAAQDPASWPHRDRSAAFQAPHSWR